LTCGQDPVLHVVVFIQPAGVIELLSKCTQSFTELGNTQFIMRSMCAKVDDEYNGTVRCVVIIEGQYKTTM
jgi:hypothetical protein